MPWLLLAERYQLSGDWRHFDETFEKASKATRIDSYASYLYQLTQESLSPELTSLEKTVIWGDIGADAHISVYSGSDFVEQVCSAMAATNDRLSKECGALANLFVFHSDNIRDIKIGANIGKTVGWPKIKVVHLTNRAEALTSIMEKKLNEQPNLNDSIDKSMDCQATNLINEYFEKLGKLGEVGAAKYYLSQSGKQSE